jgi:hypothetical protein
MNLTNPSSSKNWFDWVPPRSDWKGSVSPLRAWPSGSLITWSLDRILVCRDDEISFTAIRAINRLKSMDEGPRAILLRWLANKVRLALNSSTPRIRNCIAAIEVLAGFKSPSTPELVELSLSGSVAEHHLYAIGLARTLSTFPYTGQRVRIAAQIARLFEEVVAQGALNTAWKKRLGVEAFRSLSAISPTGAIGSISRHLLSVGNLELTPILESLAKALRNVEDPTQVSREFRELLETLWHRFSDPTEEFLINRAGIISCILELRGRCVRTLADEARRVDSYTHPLKAQVLYLFVERPLDFLTTDERLTWYSMAVTALLETEQMDSFQKVFRKMFEDTDESGKDRLRLQALRAVRAMSNLPRQ